MDPVILGGLVDQWVWRCQMVVTEFQLGRPIDFKGEVEALVAEAEKQARLLDGDGLIQRLHFTDAGVRYQNAFVRTAKFVGLGEHGAIGSRARRLPASGWNGRIQSPLVNPDDEAACAGATQ